jgi:hypothetical protein
LGTSFEREANCRVRNFKGSGFSTPSLEIRIAAESLFLKEGQKMHKVEIILDTR